MPAPSSSPSAGGGASSPPPPRAMKRELAFALQSLSEISASPGRTRSGRTRAGLPDPSASSLKRRKRSAADLVSPPTPPVDAEPPSQPLLHDPASHVFINPINAAAAPQVKEAPDPATATEEEELIPTPDTPSAAGLDVLPAAGLNVNALHAAGPDAPTPVEDSSAPMEEDSIAPVEGDSNAPVEEDSAAGLEPGTLLAPALPAAIHKPDNTNSGGGGNQQMHIADNALVAAPLPAQDIPTPAAAAPLPAQDTCTPAPTAPLSADHIATPAATAPQDNNTPAAGAHLAAQDTTTPAATTPQGTTSPVAELKPARRFTRSLLKNKPDEEEATPCESQATPQHSNDASVDSALLLEKPQRRFTRSLLKAKVDSTLVASEDVLDTTSDSPSSVKKMEMKMSKKVACLTKHPANIRELLSTGLLEGIPVMYIIPHSKRAVLRGVITGCNIRCFCQSCNGSKAVSAYIFEQHAESTKKHPADYIYLGNGNSLRDVMRASERSPLEALEKTIRSKIDPVVKKSIVNCLNCDEHIPPSSQTESVLCRGCVELKQPQDPPTPSYPCKSNSSLTPSSKDYLVKKICSSKKEGSAGKVTNKDTGLHKLVFNVLLDGTEVAYYVDGQRKVDGYIKDQRIFCNHCNRVVSPSAFEAHAGEGSRRKPYDNIFTSNGVSLHELSMKISKDMGRSTDDLCRECGLGGDIFPCKICPRSFHPACVGLSEAPSEWYCDNCRNLVQKEKALAENKNAKAAGRQAGVDSIEQIMKRAIRIVPISDDLGGCALCKQKDFNNAVFDERTVILCDQCEKEYHVGCLQSQWQVDLKELPEGEWFCCSSCSELRYSLDKIISSGAQLLLEPHMDIIRKKYEARDLCMDTLSDLRWQLLSGRSATEDGSLLLSAAVPIFHQSFDPIIEAHTGRDLIPEMVNGRGPKDGMPGQDYSGMYCAVLTQGSTVVSAALLRVMGGDVAELPLVATSKDLQGLGYFQALFSCIERMLASLKVKHFVLPAAHEAEGIWMKKFGFSRIPQEQLEAYLNGAHLTIFYGTSNLYKAVPLP